MTEKKAIERVIFDHHMSDGVHLHIRFGEAGASLEYFINEVRVERADFETVMNASRALSADMVAMALGEEGWIISALDRIAEHLDPDIEDTFAYQLLRAMPG